MAVMKAFIVLALVCVPGASANPAPTLAPAPAPTVPVPGASANPAPTLAGASANPAPMVLALLTEDKLCVGLSMKSHWLACVANTAMTCFAGNAITGEATFEACFFTGVLTENCLAKAKNDDKYHCVGLEISDDMLPCIEEVAWNCYDGSLVYTAPTFVACFLVKVVTCSA